MSISTDKRQLKVLFLPTANAGVVWYRMMSFFKYIREDKSISPAMDRFDPKRQTPYEWQLESERSSLFLNQLQSLIEQADMVVLQYIVTDYGIAIIKSIKQAFPDKPLLMEIDDYCLAINEYSPAIGHYKPGCEGYDAVIAQCQLSDAIITSTGYLAKLYSEFNKKIYTIPNGIDFAIWDKVRIPKKKKNAPIRIGWAGAASHNDDIKFIEPVIYRILDKYPNVEFFFKSGAPDFLVKKHDRIKCKNDWHNVYEYPQALADLSFDIGLAPLLDNNFNRAKSNLRWLEYSALKIPTVCSRVEPFKKSVTDGVTGYLCSERDEWFNAISLLVEQESIRRDMGQKAYAEVKQKFNTKTIAGQYVSLLKEIYDDFRNPKDDVSPPDAGSDNGRPEQLRPAFAG